MIKEWISEYKPQNEEDTFAALHEIMQKWTVSLRQALQQKKNS